MTTETGPQGQGKPSRPSSAQEWGDIFRQIQDQVRREAARAVGLPDDADWDTIGCEAGEAVRREAAETVGLHDDADWAAIGQRAEHTVRGTVADLVGTSPESDWATIGRAVDAKVHAFLDGLFRKHGPAASDGQDKTTIAKDEPPVDPWA